ncbi:hypothetical protein ACLKA7_001953 [Drosophila subpalustris]
MLTLRLVVVGVSGFATDCCDLHVDGILMAVHFVVVLTLLVYVRVTSMVTRARITEGAAKFPDYIEENGQLYRNLGHRADDEDFIPWKLCAPSGQRRKVLQECHDTPTAGHQGVRKTVCRLSQRYYWPGMFRDAARYVKCCEVCRKYKCEQRKPAGQMLTRQVSEPMAVLCADFVGPLPLSKRGNTMLLVFQDAFSKWVELIPLERATAALLQTAFRERILMVRRGIDPVVRGQNPGQTLICSIVSRP